MRPLTRKIKCGGQREQAGDERGQTRGKRRDTEEIVRRGDEINIDRFATQVRVKPNVEITGKHVERIESLDGFIAEHTGRQAVNGVYAQCDGDEEDEGKQVAGREKFLHVGLEV